LTSTLDTSYRAIIADERARRRFVFERRRVRACLYARPLLYAAVTGDWRFISSNCGRPKCSTGRRRRRLRFNPRTEDSSPVL
jgi:hypothetical protein